MHVKACESILKQVKACERMRMQVKAYEVLLMHLQLAVVTDRINNKTHFCKRENNYTINMGETMDKIKKSHNKKSLIIHYVKIMFLLVISLVLITGCGKEKKSSGFKLDLKDTSGKSTTSVSASTNDGLPYYMAKGMYEDEDISYIPPSKNSDGYSSLYTNKYYEDYFGAPVTVSDVTESINANTNFDEQFKKFVIGFVTDMYNFYGDALEMRVFNYNIKTAEVIYLSQGQLSVTGGAMAKYNYEENNIQLLDSFDYEDERNLIILRHELGHAFNCLHREIDGKGDVKVLYCTQGKGGSTGEPADVVFTSAPFLDEYSESVKANLGYGLVTNIYRIIIDCIDYNPVETTARNISGFKAKLEPKLPSDISIDEFLKDLDLISRGYLTPSLEPEEELLDKFYSALSSMYIDKHVTKDMSNEDINKVRDDMKAIICQGVNRPELYGYDTIDRKFDNLLK